MHSKRNGPIGFLIAWSFTWVIVLQALLFLYAVITQISPGLFGWNRLNFREFIFWAVLLAPIGLFFGFLFDWWWISRKYSGRTLLTINLSSEANDILKNLARRSGGDEADVLRKSLGLMVLSMQARERGLAVGTTNRPEALETEFTGFSADLDG